MADNITPATELDAVNTMLRVIGDTRVNSLSGTLPIDAAEAHETLQEILRDLQTEGWYWNVEYYTFNPDISGKIKLPSNALQVDTVDESEGLPVTTRDGYLYNLTPYESGLNWTDKGPVHLKITFGLSYDDMPASAKTYAYHRASRIFAARQENDQIALQTAGSQETAAFNAMRREENRFVPKNARNNASIRAILARGVDLHRNAYGARVSMRNRNRFR